MSKPWTVSINPSVKSILDGSANRGVALAAEHILGESNKTVPIEESILLKSGTVTTDPATFTAAIAYDTPYAATVHEDMSARHDEGKAAKFLENAMNSETNTVREIIAATIRGEF